MILNELSVHGSMMEQEDINQVISNLLNVCHKISQEKGDLDFYYTEELLTGELIPGYSIHDWLKNPQVPHREKAFFRTIINRKQLIDFKDFPGSEMIVELESGEKASSVGCLMAFELESYVISMNTSLLWQSEEIGGTYVSLEEEDRKVSVQNCCFPEQLYRLEEKEKDRMFRMISSGTELWEKRDRLYPHLIFCDDVQKQLGEAKLALHIRMIMKRLQILEDYFEGFDGKFDKNDMGYGCRNESETVEKNDELRRLRVFRTPYGKEEFFTWHISFSGNFPGRIHFMPDAEHQVGIVGYIGKHLPTGKFSTI